MTIKENLELVFLHALPLDGSMWAGQMQLLPGSTYAPTLYPLGDSIEAWAGGPRSGLSGSNHSIGKWVSGARAVAVLARAGTVR